MQISAQIFPANFYACVSCIESGQEILESWPSDDGLQWKFDRELMDYCARPFSQDITF